ncbi:MAG: histidinol dehydrogenase, partial [Woeseia sp.]
MKSTTGMSAPVNWQSLSAAEQARLLSRPAVQADADIVRSVRGIIEQVRKDGDAAIAQLTRKFDGAILNSARVTDAEIAVAQNALSAESVAAIDLAITNVRRFH